MQHEEYIGDGVYVSFDGWGFKLRTMRGHIDHWIYLDWEMLAELSKYVKRMEERGSVGWQ